MKGDKNRRSTATAPLVGQVIPAANPQVLSTQRGWVECSYAGEDELVLRGTVTGVAYHFRPGVELAVSIEDWPVLNRTGLLQRLYS